MPDGTRQFPDETPVEGVNNFHQSPEISEEMQEIVENVKKEQEKQ